MIYSTFPPLTGLVLFLLYTIHVLFFFCTCASWAFKRLSTTIRIRFITPSFATYYYGGDILLSHYAFAVKHIINILL